MTAEAGNQLLSHMVDWANRLHHHGGIGVIFDYHMLYLARRYAALTGQQRATQ